MGNQNKYLLIYIFILCVTAYSLVQLAQAEEQSNSNSDVVSTEIEQAVLDQMLAPIALYPDTLLSHILVASTYPLEIVQAARWRSANDTLDAEAALDYAETQDWDPSVQALLPFTDLLQTMSNDLQWLQQLGDAFLFNEEQVLSSIQSLRQKAYAQGNLNDSEYLDVEQQDNQIVIQPVQKEVVYIPYYDTRVVYGNWWWHNRQPHRWNRPLHSVFVAGLYWSVGFHIRPTFYFGGFQWRKRHIFTDYSYRRNSSKHWSRYKTANKVVKIRESQRWNHNKKHRRGVQYHLNGKRVTYVNKGNHGRTIISKDNQGLKNNKKRVLKYDSYSQKEKLSNKRVKSALNSQSNQKGRNKEALKHKYKTQVKKSTVIKENRKQVVNDKKGASTQQKDRNKASKKQNQSTSYNNKSQAKRTSQNQKAKSTNKSTKQTYRGNNSQSNKQRYKAQNTSRQSQSQKQRNQNKH